MKNFLKHRALAAAILIAPVAIAEDIEIYSATLGTGGSGAINPNLLFIADTSGSMADYVATEVTGDSGTYDSTIDYDTDADDDNIIYVYSDLESYTGVYITPEQNACQSIDDTYALSPDYPIYNGQAMQWIPSLVEVLDTEAVVCVEESLNETEVDYSGVVGTYYDGWQTIATFDQTQIALDSELTLDVSPVNGYRARGRSFGLDGRIQVIEMNSSGAEVGNWSTTSCTVDTGRTSSDDCTFDTGDIPFSYFQIRITLRGESYDVSNNSGNNTTVARDISHETTFTYNIDAPATYTDGAGGACTPSEATYATVEDGDWSAELRVGDTSEFILECANDQGVHGATDGSTDVFAALCGTAQCATPYYTSSTGIDWSTSGADFKYFVSGNYHDYLNATLTVGGARVWEATESYYDASDSFREDYNSPFTYDTWCDESESDLYFLESDGSYTPLGSFRDDYFTDSINDPGTIYQCQKKQEVMIAAMADMASSMTGVNMGVMMFNTGESDGPTDGGTVAFAVRDIDDYMGGGTTAMVSGDNTKPTVRSAIISEIESLPASGGTPLSEAMYEAYRYYSGRSEENNNYRIDDYYNDGTTGGNYAFADRSYNNNDLYDSPIDHSCQVNSIVYISDGAPSSSDNDSDTDIESLAGSCSGNCLDEMAGYMYDNDMNSNIDGVNNVITYTVGFDIDLELLSETAIAGGGAYYTANNYSDLQSAFQQILIDIALSEPSVLVAPAVSVNAFNELQHRDQIYYATFKPRSTPRWEGNVKKYTITGQGVVQDNSNPPINAIDPSTGFFSTYAQSYWSDTPDGAYVELGGYREQLTNTRSVYIDGGALSSAPTGIVPLATTDLLSTAATGAADAAEAAELRDWLLGIDIDDDDGDLSTSDANQYAGDSLHSKPFVVTYSGTSAADALDILYVTTNQGVLHAVDARDAYGTEKWAYVPLDTLDNIKHYRDDPNLSSHVYGLDGEATIWTTETATSTPTNFDLETAYMYQGMRRGGRNYYAWDISNGDLQIPGDAPISNLWANNIVGGTGDFVDLGQSWSKMIRTKIRYGCNDEYSNTGCTEKDVLVFSGGYDTYYDDETKLANSGAETVPVMGNTVYVVDALTGALLWSAGSTSSYSLQLPMYNSIPGDPSPIDIDGDGDMDMLFFVDISGMVFRVDFDESKAVNGTGEASYATGGNIANLTETSVFRRFYNGIDVSLNTPIGENAYLALSVGSGYRAHPKEEETWANKFYVLIDENLDGPERFGANSLGVEADTVTYNYAKTYGVDAEGNEIITARAVVTPSVLHAYTSADPYNKGRVDTVSGEPDGEYGFYRTLDLTKFEKILQTSVSFDGDILVASYIPISDTTNATCGSGQIGSGRIYKFDIETGESTFDTDQDGDVDSYDDDFFTLTHEGIPPDPTILLVPELVTCFGTECSDDWLTIETGQAERTFWRED